MQQGLHGSQQTGPFNLAAVISTEHTGSTASSMALPSVIMGPPCMQWLRRMVSPCMRLPWPRRAVLVATAVLM